MSWYKTAKIGEGYLKAKGVPIGNIGAMAEYLHSLPDEIQTKLMNDHIKDNPNISVKELSAIVGSLNVRERPTLDPLTMKLVNETSQNRYEREWIIKQIQDKKLNPREDMPKTRNALLELNKIDNIDIGQFKDFSELFKYIKQFRVEQRKEIELPTDGNVLLEDTGDMQLYEITNQESLDAIGGGASWCVLTENGGYDYKPFEYWCFVFNGVPKILVHPASGQIKDDTDAVLTDRGLVSKIKPYMEDHAIVDLHAEYAENHEEQELDDDEMEQDFEEYDSACREIDLMKNNMDMSSLMEGHIRNNLSNITILDEKDWSKYIHVIAESISDVKLDWSGFDLPKDVINYLVNYLKVNGMNEELGMLEDQAKKFVLRGGTTLGRYKKVMPESLQTKEMSEYFNKVQEDDNFKDKESELRLGRYLSAENVKDFSREDWETQLLNSSNGQHSSPAGVSCPFDDLLNSPELWKKRILRSPDSLFPKAVNVEDDPQVRRARKNFLKNQMIRNPSRSSFSQEKYFGADLINEVNSDKEAAKQAALVNPRSGMVDSETISNDKDMKEYFGVYWRERLKVVESDIVNCPIEEIKNDPDIWSSVIKKQPSLASHCALTAIHEDADLWKEVALKEPSALQFTHSEKIKGDYNLKREVILSRSETWDRLREDIYPEKNNPEIKKEITEILRAKVKEDPSLYNRLSPKISFSKEDPETFQTSYNAWKSKMMKEETWNTYAFGDAPRVDGIKGVIQNDQELKNNLIPKWKKTALELPQQSWWNVSSYMQRCPFEEIKKDSKFQDELIEKYEDVAVHLDIDNPTIWKKLFLRFPNLIGKREMPTDVNDIIENSPDVRQAELMYWKQVLESDPTKYNTCPEDIFKELFEMPHMRKIFTDFRKDQLMKSPESGSITGYPRYDSHPEIDEIEKEMQVHPEVQGARYDYFKRRIISLPHQWENINGEELRGKLISDPEVQRAMGGYYIGKLYSSLQHGWTNCDNIMKRIPSEFLPAVFEMETWPALKKEYEMKKKEDQQTNSTSSRLNSSAFNDNYIGKIS